MTLPNALRDRIYQSHDLDADAKITTIVGPSGNFVDVLNNALNVNISGTDIEIGAVEIKDHDSGDRLDIGSNATVGTWMPVGLVAWSPIDVRGTDAEGDAPTENPNLVAGWDGTNIYTLKTDTSGQLQVDVLSMVPGTGSNSLGKAEDSAHNSGDVGVLSLGVRNDNLTNLVDSDGDYVPFSVDGRAGLYTSPERKTDVDLLDSTTGWSVINDDTDNLGTTTNHVTGTAAVKFDKVDGAGNTVFAGIQKTVSLDLSIYHIHETHHIALYLSSLSNVDYFWVRMGTDSSNYNEWRVDSTDLTTGWQVIRMVIGAPTNVVGDGYDQSNISWIAVGVAFNSQSNTLTDITVNHWSIHSGLHTVADFTAQVGTSISTPNVRLNGYGGSTDTNTGNASSNTLRTVLASDQPSIDVDINNDVSWSMATGTLTANGNLIAAPSAGNHLLVRSVTFSNSDASNSGRMQGKDGSAGSTLIQCWLASDGGGFGFYFGDKPLVLSSATAFYGTLTTTTSVDYTIQYKTVAD